MKPINVIMDVDPGVDDIFALILGATHPDINLLGITTCFGNKVLRRTNRNALMLMDLIGRKDIPVAKGSEVPLVKPLYPYAVFDNEDAHGGSGVGWAEVVEFDNQNHELDAVEFIAKTVRECDGEVALVPVGPLTNIAKFIQKYPELLEKISVISIMGGSVSHGNMSPYAEVNIYFDPEAAAIVFGCGLPIVMCGLEGTWSSYFKREEWAPVLEGDDPLKKWLYNALHCYARVYEQTKPGVVIHDSMALAYLIDPSIVHTKPAYVTIECGDNEHNGQTVCDFDCDPAKFNAQVALGCDREAMFELFKNSIAALKK